MGDEMSGFVNSILQGDCAETLKMLPDKSVDCCVTSPPYYMQRDYGIAGQLGVEETPDLYVDRLISVFGEVYRVLKDAGTLWVNIGDGYNGSGKNVGNTRPTSRKQFSNTGSGSAKPLFISGMKSKQLVGIPFRFALAMMANGWILRQDIIWAKRNCMPESVKDRFCRSHEYIFMFSKQPKYYFNSGAALEPATSYDGGNNTKCKGVPQRGYATKDGETGISPQHHGKNIPTYPMRIKRDVWFVSSEPSSERHYAMFPQKLILPCILCGCPEGGVVLDPFMGSGTTGAVAKKHFRKYIGCEINPEYIKIAKNRIADINPLFETGESNDYR